MYTDTDLLLISDKSITLLNNEILKTVIETSHERKCVCTMSAAVAMRLNCDVILDVNVWRVVMTPVVALMLKYRCSFDVFR